MNNEKVPSQKLVFGLVLVAFGILAFVDTMDLWSLGQWWRLWPIVLIVLGLASEFDALRERRSGSGGALVAVGVWFFVATRNYFGLDHRTAFPVAIAVFGFFMAVHALVDRPDAPQKKENNHESC